MPPAPESNKLKLKGLTQFAAKGFLSRAGLAPNCRPLSSGDSLAAPALPPCAAHKNRAALGPGPQGCPWTKLNPPANQRYQHVPRISKLLAVRQSHLRRKPSLAYPNPVYIRVSLFYFQVSTILQWAEPPGKRFQCCLCRSTPVRLHKYNGPTGRRTGGIHVQMRVSKMVIVKRGTTRNPPLSGLHYD